MRFVAPLPVNDDTVNIWRRNLAQSAGVEVTADSEEKTESLHQVRLRQGAATTLGTLAHFRNVSYWALQILRDFPSFFFMTFVFLFNFLLIFVFIWRVCLRV